MMYGSTRSAEQWTFSEALGAGRPADGGYFVPEALPTLTAEDLAALADLRFTERLQRLFKLFAPELTESKWRRIIDRAFPESIYGERVFQAHPLNPYRGREYLAEAFNMPSGQLADLPLRMSLACLEYFSDEKFELVSGLTDGQRRSLAFQGDLAESCLRSYCFAGAKSKLKREAEENEGAAAEVSAEQTQTEADSAEQVQASQTQAEPNALQPEAMRSAESDETSESALTSAASLSRATGAELSQDTATSWQPELPAELPAYDFGRNFVPAERARRNYLAEAPGRLNMDGSDLVSLLTAVACLISAYCDCRADERFNAEQPLDLALPANDLNWILAAVYAKAMGLPLGLTSCSALREKVIAEFLRSGRYKVEATERPAHESEWNRSLQAGLERLVFEMSGRRREKMLQLLAEMDERDCLQMDKTAQLSWKDHLIGISADLPSCQKRMKRLYDESDYLLDAYTLTALFGRESLHKKRAGDLLILNICHPGLTLHFCAEALFGKAAVKSSRPEQLLPRLNDEAGLPPLAPSPEWRLN